MDAGAMGLWHAVQFYDHHKLKDEYSYASWPDVSTIKLSFFAIQFPFLWLGFETSWRDRVLLWLVVHCCLDWNISTVGCLHHVLDRCSVHSKWEAFGANQEHAVPHASLPRQAQSLRNELCLCLPRPVHVPWLPVWRSTVRILSRQPTDDDHLMISTGYHTLSINVA